MLGSADSALKSPSVFVGDVNRISLSVQTSTGSSSAITVSLSNDDHRYQAGNQFFSAATVILQQGMYTVDPGSRWIQVQRPPNGVSAASNVTALLNLYYV